jgi:hypothetical protein
MSHEPAFRALCLVLAAGNLVACLDKPYDPDGPGDFIGAFTVDAKSETNTCGADVFDAPVPWIFDVRLSRDLDLIYWDNGAEFVTGKLASDKRSFSFDTTILVDMRDQNSAPWLPPCTMQRRDRSDGKIADDDTAFTGQLSYDYAPTSGSDCSDLVMTEPPLFAVLPCGMTFTLAAKRTSDTP